MKIRQYSAKNIFSKSSPAKFYKSIWMILGPLNARSQRTSNAPNPIDFLWLKTKLSLIPCGDHLSADDFYGSVLLKKHATI